MTETILLNRRLLSEQIADLLTSSIVNGEYAIGDKLPTESNLCYQYNVSRTVIREALNMLKQKGLVESRVAKGTFVISNLGKGIGESIDMILSYSQNGYSEELLEFRTCLEPEFAALAAAKADANDLEKINEHIKEMERCLLDPDEEKNVEKLSEQDMSFHFSILEATKNTMMISVMMPIFEKIHKQQYQHLKLRADAKFHSLEYHKKIFKALKEGNSENARKLMREHITSVQTDFNKMKAERE